MFGAAVYARLVYRAVQATCHVPTPPPTAQPLEAGEATAIPPDNGNIRK